MIPLTLAELSAAKTLLRGDLTPSTTFLRIERNSRDVTPGDLFIAIKGERFDGHAFVADAAARGATAALVSKEWSDQQPEPPIPLFVADDPVAALQRIAANWRNSLDINLIGVTGSIGKTSTKEVIATILGQRFVTYRSPGNMNSEIGLPLSLREVVPGAHCAVLEMGGAYAFGELALLASIARPSICVVTNVHPIHLERMGSIEAIAETKAELVDAIPETGVAVLNGDDPRVRAMANRCRGRVILYGQGEGNHVRATDVESLGIEGTAFWLHLNGERFHMKVPLMGSHAPDLALAAIAIGDVLGMHISEMIPGFKDPGIQVRLLISDGPNGARLIDDSYNASAPSVLSALGLLEQMPAVRRIAILGDMRELGEVSDDQHRLVGRRAADVADVLITFGSLARTIASEATDTAQLAGKSLLVQSFGLEQRAEVVPFLVDFLREGDVALIKGSRGLEMEEFVSELQRLTEREDDEG